MIVSWAGMEQQADEFAAELLTPEHVIRRELTATALEPARLVGLKAVWEVSMQALYERAYRSGRVSNDERQRFYSGLNARGWKINEPGADLVPDAAGTRRRHCRSVAGQRAQSRGNRTAHWDVVGVRR
jgi:Zn-dependent peptidase ImmA (M78 family)